MHGFGRGVRDGVTGRQVWQDFLDWLRRVGREVAASPQPLNRAVISSDRVEPLISRGAAGASSGDLAAIATVLADEAEQEIDEVELLEFLAADHDPVQADPEFRERLRDRLWALVQAGAIARPRDH